MIRIVTDSTCDIPDEIVKELNITVVPCFINFGSQSYKDGVEITRQEFYERLVISRDFPTTSAPNVEAFANTYQKLVKEGADGIISIHMSANLGSTYNAAQLAAETISAVPVKVIDSRQLSMGLGFLVIAAARMAAIGRQMGEIIESVKEMIGRVYAFAVVDTLEYLRRSGRISHLKYQLGTLLDIKPVIQIYNGVVNMEMTRTTKKAFNRLITTIKELQPLDLVTVVHTNAKEKAEELLEVVRQLFPEKEHIFAVDVCPAIGTHMGPNVVGFVCVTQKTS